MDLWGMAREQEIRASLHRLLLQLRCGRLDRCHLAADVAVGFGGAFVDFVAAGDEEFAEVLAAEADVVRLLRSGDYEVHSASLIADLNAARGGDVETACCVHAEAADFVLLNVIPLEFKESLRNKQFTVRLDLSRINEATFFVGQVKKRLIWRQRSIFKPDFVRARVISSPNFFARLIVWEIVNR